MSYVQLCMALFCPLLTGESGGGCWVVDSSLHWMSKAVNVSCSPQVYNRHVTICWRWLLPADISKPPRDAFQTAAAPGPGLESQRTPVTQRMPVRAVNVAVQMLASADCI